AVLLAPVAGLPVLAAHALFSRTGIWLPVAVPSLFVVPVAWSGGLTWYYLTTLRDRERIRRAFNHYLAPPMVERVAAEGASVALGGEEIVGTVLFTDVEGFTGIAERLGAVGTAKLLNGYFSQLTRAVFYEQGTLIKYIGDAVFAIWGAPVPQA